MEKGNSDYHFLNIYPMKMRLFPFISDRYMIKCPENAYEASIKN